MLKALPCPHCLKLVTVRAVREADGFCPHCENEIDLDDIPPENFIGDEE